MKDFIFLPGTYRQFKLLLQQDIKADNVLVIGAGSEEIAMEIRDELNANVIIIVDDNYSLLSSRYLLKDEKEISVRMMDYDNTDFREPKFNLVYAQASISTKVRNKIVKEIKNILLPGGYFCAGEITALEKKTPNFVKDLWDYSGIVPLIHNELSDYYSRKGFEIIYEEDLTSTLKDFYSKAEKLLKAEMVTISTEDREANRKLLRRITHEAKIYLTLGGDKYIGFKSLLMRKKE